MGWKKFPDILADVQKKAKQDLETIHADFAQTLLTELPVESGHAHQAYLTAIEEAVDTDSPVSVAVSSFESEASGDPTAISAASGSSFETATSVGVSITPGLPFIETLDQGGTIGKIGGISAGRKVDGVAGIGKLYGERLGGGSAGFLMWYEGGKQVFQMKRDVQALGFIKTAFSIADSTARQLGWKTR